jgi:hypothetical protein
MYLFMQNLLERHYHNIHWINIMIELNYICLIVPLIGIIFFEITL